MSWAGLAGIAVLVGSLASHGPPVARSATPRSRPESPSTSIAADSPRYRSTGKRSDSFSNILLTTQHGEQVRFYDDLVKDRAVMVNLMYTTCPKICPANSTQLVKVHEYLERWMGTDITILSLSIDPEVDTPERLNRYWEVFGSKPGWLFLTGDYDEIDRLRRELGVYDLDPGVDADKTQHAGIITYGNDRTDRWSALPILMHARQLAQTVVRTTWDDQWTREARTIPDTRSTPDVHRGHGIIRRVDLEHGQVLIDHEDIPGLMMAMTMAFDVPDRALLEGLAPDQPVHFRVQHAAGQYRILSIAPGH
jgi:protein SCO1/2